jgi:asparagine synthase (glutamine-hydrolysing)
MCGIAGIATKSGGPVPNLEHRLAVMNTLQEHRGPDGKGTWAHPTARAGFAHARLSIIDLATGAQPMGSKNGNQLTFNGEIYNYIELRAELGVENFETTSDTEVILKAYDKWGMDCVNHFRGMFAFALWDEKNQRLFCARDRFGIKPFVYATIGDTFYFASEPKAILPFLPSVETDLDGFKDYLTFQFCLAGKTLFKGISELPAAYSLTLEKGNLEVARYWEVYYTLDWDHTARYFEQELRARLEDSVRIHLRSDVPLGAYISGGLDSSTVAAIAGKNLSSEFMGFTGKFASYGAAFDESEYARECAASGGFDLKEIDITCQDFVENIERVIYHLDWPVAGPGSFPQYMVSKLAAEHRKVVLGGQGGDEIFGGYTRYLIAYFEQCIKAAIEGTTTSGNFVVTYESIIPNLKSLANYKPMLQEFWREGLFGPMDRRYFTLINRAPHLGDEIKWERLEGYSPFETFQETFNQKNVDKKSYFDLMTHFDFKTLLPALLHVEDRVSMAHGLESRVPLLDHHIVEFAATIPSDVKFLGGDMKHVFKNVVAPYLPKAIVDRKDKMGFPTPLNDWIKGGAREYVQDIFSSSKALGRDLVDNRKVLEGIENEPKFGRKIWGLLCIELWQRVFHDREHEYKQLVHQ